MQKFLTVSVLIGFSCTSCITLQTQRRDLAPALETKWMKRVVEKHACLESLGPVLEEDANCASWTRYETAEALVDPATGRLFIGGSDGFMHVVDSAKGSTLKRSKLDGSLMSSPRSVDNDLVFGTTRGFAYRLKKDDLSVVWKRELDSGLLRGVTIVGDNALFITQLGTLYAVSLKTGEVTWSKKRELPNRVFLWRMSTPVVVQTKVNGSLVDALVLGNPNGKLDFFDTKTGDVLDSIQVGGARDPFGDVSTTPIVTESSVYAASYASSLIAVDRLSRARRWELKEPGITELAFAQDIIVAAGAKFVLGVSAQNGKVLWRYRYEKGAPTAIQIDKGEVYIGSDKDGLYVLDLLTGTPVQVLGSGLGFASPVKNLGEDVLAMSAAGALLYFNRTDSSKEVKSGR